MRSALGVLVALVLPAAAFALPPIREGSISPMEGFLTHGGVVNFVQGDVVGARAGFPQQALRSRNKLEKDDVVRIGRGGRAEILLNPGYYLRLSENTEVTLLGLAPDNMKVKLSHGSAIVEVLVVNPVPYFPTDQLYELVTVVTPRDEIVITAGGLYRLDVSADGAAQVKVRHGSADVRGTRVERGKRATILDGLPTLTRFEKELGDAFDDWSRERAAELLTINKSLKNSDWYRQFRKNRSSHFEIDAEGRIREAKERGVVSAISGRIGFAEDGVSFRRGGGAWEPLAEGAELRDGDEVRTEESRRCEILLFPTCLLHLSGATEVGYSKAPDGAVTVRVRKGSVILVNRLDTKNQRLVTLGASGGDFEIVEAGNYRLDVPRGGHPEFSVYRGKARQEGRDIKGGKRATPAGTGSSVSSFDRGDRDSFDIWSQQRASIVPIRHVWNFATFRKNRAKYGGMWHFAETRDTYTFVPGVLRYRSPYGGEYSVRFRAMAGQRL